MSIRLRGITGALILRLATRILRRRHRRLMRVRDDVADRWTRQAHKLGRIARQLEMDGSIRSGIAQHRPDLMPEDAEILHRPSILRVVQNPAGQVSPVSGTELAADVSVHHDMSPPRIVAHQMPRSQGRHEYALDIWNVRGNFVSLALALPSEQVSRIGKNDLIRVDYTIELEQKCDVFARLNLAHGPNVEQVIRQLDLRKQDDVLEFDVHYTAFDPTRAKEIWIDLIFNTRPLNRVVIRDIVISRRPRLSL